MRKLLKAMRSEKGFTLIELLVVIGILAALAGVVTLAVTQFIGRGQCEACKTEIHNCQTAVAAYMVDYPGAPPNTCNAYQGITLLTPCKYCASWAVSASGVVDASQCTMCP
jgi:prepilin-type N-terminal cleavage/methylation domain-containing protein